MNKEKLMQLISETIDLGASVHIHVAGYDKDLNELFLNDVTPFASAASEILDSPVEVNEDGNRLTVDKDYYRFSFSYQEGLAEDVDLSGMEEEPKYREGDKVLVRLPYRTEATIYKLYPNGSIGLEIDGHRLYSIREKHIIEKVG